MEERPNSSGSSSSATGQQQQRSRSAHKLFISQAKQADEAPASCWQLADRTFHLVWIQGTVVKRNADFSFVLDDGTGVIQMDATQYANTYEADNGSQWTGCREAQYLMALGELSATGPSKDDRKVNVHHVIDLSSDPQREALWTLEVVHGWQRYQHGHDSVDMSH